MTKCSIPAVNATGRHKVSDERIYEGITDIHILLAQHPQVCECVSRQSRGKIEIVIQSRPYITQRLQMATAVNPSPGLNEKCQLFRNRHSYSSDNFWHPQQKQ